AVAPAELAAEHPELDLTGVELAAVEPGSGYADPVATTFAFASRAVHLGARIRQGVAVRGLAVAGGRVVGVDTDDGRVGADAVVLACGPWVDPLARTAGFELGITPERSQIAFFRGPGAPPPPPGGDRRGPRHLLPAPCRRPVPAGGGGRPPRRRGGDRPRGRGLRPRGARPGPGAPGRAGARLRRGAVRPRAARRVRPLGRQPGRARQRPRGGRAVRGRRLLRHRLQEVAGGGRPHGRAGPRGQGLAPG